MKISIVTPSFNQGRYLREALESVRSQRHCSIEHLVLDGCSSDGSIALLKSLDGREDWSHLTWFSGPDGGQSQALNRGFALACGDIVGWLNSDDRYRPGCFDKVVRAFEQAPEVDVFYGDFTTMNQDGVVQRVRREIDFNRFILLYHRVSYIPTAATFFRRRVFEEGNWLQPDLHYAMDYEFFIRLADAGYMIRHIPQVLADFRIHPASKSCSNERIQAREKEQIMWAASPIAKRIASPWLQRAAFVALRWIAGLMRYSEKALRGYYFSQQVFTRGSDGALPPTS